MPKRKLRFVRSETPGVWGVCELCNREFQSMLHDLLAAGQAIEAQFDKHDCKRADVGQATAQAFREPKQKN
jgi:hypothetical protein